MVYSEIGIGFKGFNVYYILYYKHSFKSKFFNRIITLKTISVYNLSTNAITIQS